MKGPRSLHPANADALLSDPFNAWPARDQRIDRITCRTCDGFGMEKPSVMTYQSIFETVLHQHGVRSRRRHLMAATTTNGERRVTAAIQNKRDCSFADDVSLTASTSRGDNHCPCAAGLRACQPAKYPAAQRRQSATADQQRRNGLHPH